MYSVVKLVQTSNSAARADVATSVIINYCVTGSFAMPHSPTTLVVMVAVLCACVLVAGAADVVVSVPRGVVETAARPQRSRRLAVDDSTPLMLDLVLAAAPGRIVDLVCCTSIVFCVSVGWFSGVGRQATV